MIVEIDQIRGTYYSDEIEDIKLGDNITIYGDIELPNRNTNPNLFNYRNFLKSRGINYVMNIERIVKNSDNKNPFYAIKNFIKGTIAKNPSSKYLYIFILGDNRYLDDSIKKSYQNLGISHLFSISGMHISILSGIVLVFLKKINIKENGRYFLTCSFLIFYMFLVSLCPSVLRSGLFFIFLAINDIFYFNVKPINILLLTISLIIFVNPFIIYNIGFLYSSIITAALIIFSNIINKYSNYFIKLLMTSIISFCFSFPISISNYYQINILSIIYNLFFVPLISIIIFPLSLIVLFIKPLSIVFNVLISLMENISYKLSLIDSNIIFKKPSIIVIIFYYLLLFLLFKYRKKFLFIILLSCILIHYNYNVIFPSDYMLMIDVGQGDSILLHSGKYNVLIDTGGKYGSDNSIAENTLIPTFKSLGIRKIDYLFLTHGDFDHVGESIKLMANFKVKKVYFNDGYINYNEKKILNYLVKKKISYDINSLGKYHEIGNFKFYSMNKNLGNENDSSMILYGKIFNYSYILMGDASKRSEEELLDTFFLDKVDILKVGHHGSKTSTSEKFINKIKPKYALISAGLNNKFNHPHAETVDLLKKNGIDIYVTSRDGAILINFDKSVTFSTFGT